MPEPARRLSDPDDIEARLMQIGPGLSVALLLSCVKESQAARENTSKFHPPLHGPFNGYAEGTAALRAQLSKHGWKPSDKGNYARSISPDKRAAIALSTGDENAGVDSHVPPQTRCPKGIMTQKAVSANAQLSFLAELGMPEPAEEEGGDRIRTWLLLVNPYGEKLRSELSLPTHFENGTPDEYEERLILPALDLDSDPRRRRDEPDSGDDFDIEVTRKIG